jgi:hypothetical protein
VLEVEMKVAAIASRDGWILVATAGHAAFDNT